MFALFVDLTDRLSVVVGGGPVGQRKARALLEGRSHVTTGDIQALALPVLRHRVLVNYKAEAEGITVDQIISRLIEHVKPAV